MAAGLSEHPVPNTDIKTHGTNDIYAIGVPGYDPASPEKSARKLKSNWAKNQPQKPALARVENAEGYAASATEFWFQLNCGWDNILE